MRKGSAGFGLGVIGLCAVGTGVTEVPEPRRDARTAGTKDHVWGPTRTAREKARCRSAAPRVARVDSASVHSAPTPCPRESDRSYNDVSVKMRPLAHEASGQHVVCFSCPPVAGVLQCQTQSSSPISPAACRAMLATPLCKDDPAGA